MKVGFFAYTVLVSILSLPHFAEAQGTAPKVLFIGNSLTFYNTGIDTVLRQLSVSLGNPIATRRKTNPGWTLQQHFNDPATAQAISADSYDYVVLQDVSDGTLTDLERFKTYSAKLDSIVRKSGAQSVLFMTWPYVEEPRGMGDTIATAYNQQGEALGIPTVPVGWAWQRVLDETDYVMYSDNRHPTFSGTYLAACAFYSHFIGKSPAGASYVGSLPAMDAGYLAGIAFSTWSDFHRRPYALPGRIEAEFFNGMFGVATEKTTDQGAGRNLAFIQPGDWFDYPVSVPYPGRYQVGFRVASLQGGGRMELVGKQGRVLDSVDLPASGGFQTWRTVLEAMVLDSGNQTLRLNVVKGGFNLNWIEFTLDSTVTPVAVSDRDAAWGSHDASPSGRREGKVRRKPSAEKGMRFGLAPYDLIGRQRARRIPYDGFPPR